MKEIDPILPPTPKFGMTWLRTFAALALELDQPCFEALEDAFPSRQADEILANCPDPCLARLEPIFANAGWIITPNSTGFTATPKDGTSVIVYNRIDDQSWTISERSLYNSWETGDAEESWVITRESDSGQVQYFRNNRPLWKVRLKRLEYEFVWKSAATASRILNRLPYSFADLFQGK